MGAVKDVDIKELSAHLLKGGAFVDVRAPIEFQEGALPEAVNLPILDNDERARIGTCYKQLGREEAIRLGYQIVSGEPREIKIQKWQHFFSTQPEAVLYCARGGLRSKISSQWVADQLGSTQEIRRLQGGFKAARSYFLQYFEEFCQQKAFLMISGTTGTAKTHLIRALQKHRPAVDLEALAQHRGSAFGALVASQPRQVHFENTLFVASLKAEHEQKSKDSLTPILFEDESRTIGSCVIPTMYFEKMRSSPVVMIDEPLEVRVDNLFRDYILETPLGTKSSESEALAVFAKYKKALVTISRKLGGLRTQEVMRDLELAEKMFFETQDLDINRVWIEKLLRFYYDPMYLGSLEKRDPQILFRGSRSSVADFLTKTNP